MASNQLTLYYDIDGEDGMVSERAGDETRILDAEEDGDDDSMPPLEDSIVDISQSPVVIAVHTPADDIECEELSLLVLPSPPSLNLRSSSSAASLPTLGDDYNNNVDDDDSSHETFVERVASLAELRTHLTTRFTRVTPELVNCGMQSALRDIAPTNLGILSTVTPNDLYHPSVEASLLALSRTSFPSPRPTWLRNANGKLWNLCPVLSYGSDRMLLLLYNIDGLIPTDTAKILVFETSAHCSQTEAIVERIAAIISAFRIEDASLHYPWPLHRRWFMPEIHYKSLPLMYRLMNKGPDIYYLATIVASRIDTTTTFDTVREMKFDVNQDEYRCWKLELIKHTPQPIIA